MSQHEEFEKFYIQKYGPLDDNLRSGWHYSDQLQAYQAATARASDVVRELIRAGNAVFDVSGGTRQHGELFNALAASEEWLKNN